MDIKRWVLDVLSYLDEVSRVAPPPFNWILYIIGKLAEILREKYIMSKITVKEATKELFGYEKEWAYYQLRKGADEKREYAFRNRLARAKAEWLKENRPEKFMAKYRED